MKAITFKKVNGGYQVVNVKGDTDKKTWGKIQGEFIYDYMFSAVCADIKKDRFKIKII